MKGWISDFYWEIRATSSSVVLVETQDSRRLSQLLNFFLLRDTKPWNGDYIDEHILEILRYRNLEKETIINKILAGTALSIDSAEDRIKSLEERGYLKQISPERYETTEKKFFPTQILYFDAWEGLKVNQNKLNRPDNPVNLYGKKYIEQEWQEWELKKEEKQDPLTQVVTPQTTTSNRLGLEIALQAIDEEIKTKRTIAILAGILPGQHKSLRTLAEAVNNWAHDLKVMNQLSAVIIVTPDRAILPQTGLNNVIFAHPTPSTPEERETIINVLADQYHTTSNTAELSKAMAGLTLGQCESVLLKSFSRERQFKIEYISALKREQVRKQGILQILKPEYDFRRIGGYNSVKNFIKERIIDVFANPELANELQVNPLRSLLLFGIPGSGKSVLAKALAYETKLPLFLFQPGTVMDKYVGESERKMRSAIEMMESSAPCVILIEETDSLGHRSNVDTDSGTSRRMFGQMLDYTGDEQRKAIIVGTTNTPDFLDSAFLRQGRFTPIPMLLPSFSARRAIFNVHLHEKRNIKTKFIDGPQDALTVFAEKTPGFTGAEIEGVVEEAQAIAFSEQRRFITDNDILTGINGYNIALDQRIQTQNRYIEMAERICRNQRFIEEIKQEHIIN